ncbi:MAG TPA: hypothetical protein VF221_11625 [Chloroflexota bacterium]
MFDRRPSESGTQPRLLLPAPTLPGDATTPRAEVAPLGPDTEPHLAEQRGWSTETARQLNEPAGVLQEQRDGLVRLREKLLAIIRELEAENTDLRRTIQSYDNFPTLEQQELEAALAKRLQEERGITFQEMPSDIYPGKPYVTQQDLLRQGITRYSRQNISRLARSVSALAAVIIGDRVLLPPEAVEELIERETAASRDPSPRRQPGRERPRR